MNVIGAVFGLYVAVGIVVLVYRSFKGEKPDALKTVFGWGKEVYDHYKK